MESAVEIVLSIAASAMPHSRLRPTETTMNTTGTVPLVGIISETAHRKLQVECFIEKRTLTRTHISQWLKANSSATQSRKTSWVGVSSAITVQLTTSKSSTNPVQSGVSPLSTYSSTDCIISGATGAYPAPVSLRTFVISSPVSAAIAAVATPVERDTPA